MILQINFRSTAIVASLLLTGTSQAQAFGAVPGAFPPRAPSSMLDVPSETSTATVAKAEAAGR